jgi:hypothetical protein
MITPPGFEFLEQFVKTTQTAMPHMGQWVTPTLNPEELQKRIDELRTVQFWLEQNSRMLSATIQALEVQRMTLATLKTMNVSAADLKSAMNIPTPKDENTKSDPAGKDQTSAVDPTQWWNNITQQFGQLAAQVVKDSAPAKDPSPASSATPPTPKAPKKAAPARKTPGKKS